MKEVERKPPRSSLIQRNKSVRHQHGEGRSVAYDVARHTAKYELANPAVPVTA